jgi:hypothetical protein
MSYQVEEIVVPALAHVVGDTSIMATDTAAWFGASTRTTTTSECSVV